MMTESTDGCDLTGGTMKNKLLRIMSLVFATCFTLSIPISAAGTKITGSETVSSGLEGSQMTILYDASIGMPTSEANAIAQTGDGFIWIGSYSGLVRYDGNGFYRFDSSTGIASVVSLFVDSSDRLWIGTNDSGLALYKDGDITFINKGTDIESTSVRAIIEDKNGNIIIGTTHGLYYVDSELALHVIDNEAVNEMYIYALHMDTDGLIYANSVNGDIVMIKDLEVTNYFKSNYYTDFVVNCVYPDPDNPGYIYIGTDDNRILYCNPSKNGLFDHKTYEASGQTTINDILKYNDQLWICADDGIGYFNEKMKYKKLEDITLTSSVDSIMLDYEGNMWFTSSRQGVMKLTRSIFTDINRYDDLPDMVVNTTCMYNDRLYIGTDNGLVVLNSRLKKINDPLCSMLEGVRIRSIKADDKGNLWICSYSEYGLICLHSDGSMDHYNAEDGILASDKVRTVQFLENGTTAVSASGGVTFIKDKKKTAMFDQSSGISNTEILTICENKTDGEVYLGTDGGGIYVINLDNSDIKHLGHNDGLSSEVVLRIKYDSYRDIYWIITSNSIAYMKDGKITTVSNFPYANNFDIFFNDYGQLWVLSSAGIFVVNAEDMIANGAIPYEQLDSESGLPYVTTANSRSYIDDSGSLYISGTSGITLVNINDRTDDLSSIKLAIPYVEADDVSIFPDEDGSITIPSSCRRLTIHAYALSYALNNPRINYYLEGFDEQPMTTTKRQMTAVTYTNLNGGEYTFNMDLMSADGREAVNSTTLKLIKQKAWHEYWIIRILLFALGVFLIIFLIVMYFKRKSDEALKKEQETRELINEITTAFAKTIDMKDRYTNGHSFRVANYTRLLAEKLGYSKDEIADMYNIALLHDIGKLAIPDAILNKPEGLNDEEYAIMKSHAEKGYEVLKEITIAPDLAIGAGYHHERLDGKGYPNGLKEEEIPFVAQIIAVADTFDAMYSTRPYRKKLPIETVLAELKKVAGTQLNEKVVEQLVALAEEGKIK